MMQVVGYLLGVVTAIVVGVAAAWVRDFYASRKRVQIKHLESKVYAQIPSNIRGDCRLTYKGALVNNLYEHIYTVSNQSFTPIDNIDLDIVVNPPAAILDVVLLDKQTKRNADITRSGNKINLKASYLNPHLSLDDSLEIHVFSEELLESIAVKGSGSGWTAVSTGNNQFDSTQTSPLARTYLCIEGPIGVGKTELANRLVQKWTGQLLLEQFEENPYLSDFYQDRGRYAFHTQIFFLHSRYTQLQAVKFIKFPIIADYFFAKDSIFAMLNLYADDLDTYYKIYNSYKTYLPKPDLVIYLTADINTLMSRIAKRDREYERNMKKQYILELSNLYETFFESYQDAPTLKIDTTDLDIVNNPNDLEFVVKLIEQTLSLNRHLSETS